MAITFSLLMVVTFISFCLILMFSLDICWLLPFNVQSRPHYLLLCCLSLPLQCTETPDRRPRLLSQEVPWLPNDHIYHSKLKVPWKVEIIISMGSLWWAGGWRQRHRNMVVWNDHSPHNTTHLGTLYIYFSQFPSGFCRRHFSLRTYDALVLM